MFELGIVSLDTYEDKEKIKKKYLAFDIRTITIKKIFSIYPNTQKWENGKVGSCEVPIGKENLADYYIWYNINKRGENKANKIVGEIRNLKGQSGEYKKGFIFDPFIQKEPIYFNMFKIDDSKKKNENDLYCAYVEPLIKNKDYHYANNN